MMKKSIISLVVLAVAASAAAPIAQVTATVELTATANAGQRGNVTQMGQRGNFKKGGAGQFGGFVYDETKTGRNQTEREHFAMSAKIVGLKEAQDLAVKNALIAVGVQISATATHQEMFAAYSTLPVGLDIQAIQNEAARVFLAQGVTDGAITAEVAAAYLAREADRETDSFAGGMKGKKTGGAVTGASAWGTTTAKAAKATPTKAAKAAKAPKAVKASKADTPSNVAARLNAKAPKAVKTPKAATPSNVAARLNAKIPTTMIG